MLNTFFQWGWKKFCRVGFAPCDPWLRAC